MCVHVRTLEALVAGLALGAVLGALAALVLVAGAAHGETALIAGDEEVAVDREPHLIAANLAHLPAQRPQRLGLLVAADEHELVAVVRAGHQPGARLHRAAPPPWRVHGSLAAAMAQGERDKCARTGEVRCGEVLATLVAGTI